MKIVPSKSKLKVQRGKPALSNTQNLLFCWLDLVKTNNYWYFTWQVENQWKVVVLRNKKVFTNITNRVVKVHLNMKRFLNKKKNANPLKYLIIMYKSYSRTTDGFNLNTCHWAWNGLYEPDPKRQSVRNVSTFLANKPSDSRGLVSVSPLSPLKSE